MLQTKPAEFKMVQIISSNIANTNLTPADQNIDAAI